MQRSVDVAAQNGGMAVLSLLLDFDKASRSARAAAALVPKEVTRDPSTKAAALTPPAAGPPLRTKARRVRAGKKETKDGSGGSARGWGPRDGARAEGQRTDRQVSLRRGPRAKGRDRHSCNSVIA